MAKGPPTPTSARSVIDGQKEAPDSQVPKPEGNNHPKQQQQHLNRAVVKGLLAPSVANFRHKYPRVEEATHKSAEQRSERK